MPCNIGKVGDTKKGGLHNIHAQSTVRNISGFTRQANSASQSATRDHQNHETCEIQKVFSQE